MKELTVIGGGLAGTEAAWQAAELVCSNSLGSDLPHKAPGLLKAELRGLGSLLLDCAMQTAVPAGSSLAVDREAFAQLVTARIASHPLITLVHEEVTTLPDGPTIVATGPLTSPALAEVIAGLSGRDYLYFYDAVSPIVQAETVDMAIAFRQSRYDREGSASLQARAGREPGGSRYGDEGDYINCPMTRDEYEAFTDALLAAETITLKQFEREDPHFFEGCMPVEALARRGREALAFGPLRPVGLIDPRTGKRPYAVVQLRQDNLIGTLYNLVGFQTNLKWPDQKRVLRLIPGLAGAEFVRYGMMHRNTYVNAPALLQPTLQYRNRADLFFAGQIVGVEGYVGNAGTGLLAGINAARLLTGGHPLILPPATMLGALCHYVTHAAAKEFQPMKANFGILPPLPPRPGKHDSGRLYAERALTALRRFAREHGLRYDQALAAPTVETATE